MLAWRGAASAGLDSSADRAYMKAPVPRPTLQLVDKVSRSCGHTPGKVAGQRATVKAEMNGVTPGLDRRPPPRCLADFPGVWPQLRDILSTSRSVGRGTGAFIYALSADETRPALAAPRHASTALFSCRFKSCRFKCPCPPRRQRHFHDNADRAYNTLHFASQSRVPNGGVAPFGNPHKKRRYATPPRGAYRLFLLSSPPAVLVEQKSAWDWCGIFI